MSTEHAGYLITMADDLDPETSAHVVELIQQVRGVVSVEPITSDPQVAVMVTRRTLAKVRAALHTALASV